MKGKIDPRAFVFMIIFKVYFPKGRWTVEGQISHAKIHTNFFALCQRFYGTGRIWSHRKQANKWHIEAAFFPSGLQVQDDTFCKLLSNRFSDVSSCLWQGSIWTPGSAQRNKDNENWHFRFIIHTCIPPRVAVWFPFQITSPTSSWTSQLFSHTFHAA